MVRRPRPRLPYRGSLHDKPNSLCNLCRPTETYVHVGFDRAESEADLHRYAEACHDTTLRTCTVIGGCLYTLVCCDECTATGFLTCALGGT